MAGRPRFDPHRDSLTISRGACHPETDRMLRARADEQVEDRTLAVRALAALSPKLRAVVVLSFYARMTREEIARTLNLPPGTVASRQSSAMEIMRKALAEPAGRGQVSS